MPLAGSDTLVIERSALSAEEQRRHPRFVGIDANVLRLAVRPEFRGRRGLIVDVSASGMGFLLADPVDQGTALVFELRVPSSEEIITRIARVRHNRPHPAPIDAPWLPRSSGLSQFFRRMFGGAGQPGPRGEAWMVGCEFDRPLTELEIKQLLDAAV